MRPSGATAVASIIKRPAPETERLPRWRRCQSLALPSSALYWHIGETTMRLGRVMSRKLSGVKRGLGIGAHAPVARAIYRGDCGHGNRHAAGDVAARAPRPQLWRKGV